MLFTSLPTTKSGNIPLIILGNQGALSGDHPYAWPSFVPNSTNPALPCIATAELKGVTKATVRNVALWLPTPTMPFRPFRRLFVAWSVAITMPPANPNDPNYGLEDWNPGSGSVGEVVGPRFEVCAHVQPSRPFGARMAFSSEKHRQTSMSAVTPERKVRDGAVTEILPIVEPLWWIGPDSLCYLKVQLPYPDGWQPHSLLFYLRGIAVDQW